MTGESDATTRKNDSNQPLKSLGKYQIERKLGQGGMGTVYLAKHTDLKKLIALKVLPQDKAKNPILVRRFKAEAQAAGQLEHPNIVSVYDTGEIDGHLFIAMEFVDGIDLFEYLRKHKVVPVKRSIEIVKEVASALQHAYEQNIVHRDIKPSNLLVRRDGTVKITDLGLARSIDDTLETNITRAGTTVGTVDYMAPEQARNSKSADIRSDIYSLGCTWYQMLTGLPPYPDGSMTNKLHAHSTKPLPDPRAQNENIPEGVFAILQRMTAKKPEDRYQTPAELLEDINRSKLTRAAFSNEILSDLTDDGESGTTVPVFDDAVEADPKRVKSRIEDELDAVPPGSTRIERTRPPESQHDSAVPTKGRSKLPSKSRPDDNEGPSHRKPNAVETSDKRVGKNAPKPLPPKRQPIVTETAPPSGVNLEMIKQILIATALCAGAIGIGWFVFQWSSQFDSGNPPQAVQPVTNPPEAVPVPPKLPEKPEVVAAPPVVQPTVAFDIVKQTPPDWSTATPDDGKDLPVFVVGPGAMDGIHLPNLNEALQAAEKTGGSIKLLGSGPFVVNSIELGNAKRIVIAPGLEDDRPLIIVRPSGPDSAAGISLKNGVLDLRGIHFLLDRSGNPSETLKSILTVTDGQLLVRNCSFTATGSDAVPASAVVFSSVQDSQNAPLIEPRLLLEHVVIRGNGLAGVSVHRANADVLIADSLIATGTAPVFDLKGYLVPGLADGVTSKPRRIIRVVRSILSARKHVLDLAVENTEKPPSTDFLFLDSICSAEGVGNATVLVSALQWPSVSTRTGSWLTNLNWTSVSSLYLGFEQWMESKSKFKVTGIEDWERVWNKKFDAAQFQSILWQEAPFADLSLVMPSDFDLAKLPYRDVKTARGELPGCQIDGLRVPAEISQSRLFATSQRPRLPEIVRAGTDVPSIRIDLAKDDLGLFLNRNDWPSGSVIEVTGSGFKSITPIKIVNKSVRLIFRQAEGHGPPLRIHPKVTDSKLKHDTTAMFFIENGVLELQSLSLEIPTSAKNLVFPWMINAKNASLVLKGCQIKGPQQHDVEGFNGLIQWEITNASPPATRTETPFLAIVDSLLLSMGHGIQANCDSGNLFLRNSIVATRGNALNFIATNPQSPTLPLVDLEHVTFAALESAIHVEIPDDKPDVVSAPVRLFVDFCAVLPPPEFKEGSAYEPAFVECSSPLVERKRIEWWGNSNGVAKEVQTLIRRTGGEPIKAVSDWHGAWGETNDVRLLTGPKGVVLASSPLGKWATMKAISFMLDSESTGATWADGARPVGADCRRLDESLQAKRTNKDSKSPSNKSNPSKSNANRNNPGF
ncbi:serine/threonine protein kinase [Schlesneria paludicola]|uniref:serine/threonine protein kinase n=1 Tax=Schlesneria paludicola TaxID=360056 RepID=UPI00029A971D|nr:serine/threonine-protein kinase [Schlesneria paludicola]